MRFIASACRVRVEAKVAELATLMTESVMTALKTDGRPAIPASLIASTKGEAFVFAPDAPSNSSLSDGRIKPRMNRLRT